MGNVVLMLAPLYYAGGFWLGYMVDGLVFGFTLGTLVCLVMAVIGTAQVNKAKLYQLIQDTHRKSDSP